MRGGREPSNHAQRTEFQQARDCSFCGLSPSKRRIETLAHLLLHLGLHVVFALPPVRQQKNNCPHHWLSWLSGCPAFHLLWTYVPNLQVLPQQQLRVYPPPSLLPQNPVPTGGASALSCRRLPSRQRLRLEGRSAGFFRRKRLTSTIFD